MAKLVAVIAQSRSTLCVCVSQIHSSSVSLHQRPSAVIGAPKTSETLSRKA
jgi:hypothetical protein